MRSQRLAWSGCRRYLCGAATFALLLSGCGTPPPMRTLACRSATPAKVVPAADGRNAATLRVLTYNIEGLGFPARKGRGQELRQIGARLSAMRAAGTGPDIVLLQEMFSGAAKKAVADSGYPAIAPGPRRSTRPFESTREKLPGKSKLKRGEIGVRFTGSGLAIASRYPIMATDLRAYGRRSCAGLDCLANKGIVLARIGIPGVPTPIDVYNTHMNSRGASKTPESRNRAAHDRQALEASEFIDNTHDDNYPVIFGGDFNMRRSEPRWENFSPIRASVSYTACAWTDPRAARSKCPGTATLRGWTRRTFSSSGLEAQSPSVQYGSKRCSMAVRTARNYPTMTGSWSHIGSNGPARFVPNRSAKGHGSLVRGF